MLDNRPDSMRAVDLYARLIETICNRELEPGVDHLLDAGCKIAAYAYLVWEQGEHPDVGKYLWLEVGEMPGKTSEAKLINYLLRSVRPETREIIAPLKNQIGTTLSWLSYPGNWTVEHTPTFEEVYDKVHDVGLYEYHRRWMRHLTEADKATRAQEEQARDKLRRIERAEKAAELGISIDQLDAYEARQAQERNEIEDRERWLGYVERGTPAIHNWGSINDGLIYIRDGARLIRLSAADTQRVRACMVR